MGLAAPLVLYQTLNTSVKTQKSDFSQLIKISKILDREVMTEDYYFSARFVGDRRRYLHREGGDFVRVHAEREHLRRPTLRKVLRTTGQGKLGVLVPCIEAFLEASPYVAAVLAKVREEFSVQFLSLRFEGKWANATKYKNSELTVPHLENSIEIGEEAFMQLLFKNADACNKILENEIFQLSKDSREIRELSASTSVTGIESALDWLDSKESLDPSTDAWFIPFK